MKILLVGINACTTLLLLSALKIRQETFHKLSTGEGMVGFPRRIFEGDGSTSLLMIALVFSIITLMISIFNKKKKNIPPDSHD